MGDWLPVDHFARFVIAMVEEMDLGAFYAAYRADGHGRPGAHASVGRRAARLAQEGINRIVSSPSMDRRAGALRAA